MMKCVSLALLAALVCLCSSASAQQTNPPIPAKFRCPGTIAKDLTVGDKIPICLFLGGLPTPQRIAFTLTVDAHTALHLNSSRPLGETRRAGQDGVFLWASVGSSPDARPKDCRPDPAVDKAKNKTDDTVEDILLPAYDASEAEKTRKKTLSCVQRWSSETHGAAFVNLVVNLVDGTPSSIIWDNGGCFTCGTNTPACISSPAFAWYHHKRQTNGEATTDTSVVASKKVVGDRVCGKKWTDCEARECDLIVFVTWAGTDKSGLNLMSAGTRFSRFAGYTIGSLYDSAEGLFT